MISKKLDRSTFVIFYANCKAYTALNRDVFLALAFVALCAYGFELFNFNLTIDEEIHARSAEAVTQWIFQGRWGMYILNKFFLPYTVIPFAPLFFGLVFHITGIVILLSAWDTKSKNNRMLIGAVCLTFPTLTYIYTFSTINYGIGFGFFCIALSLFIFVNTSFPYKYYAIIPAVFAIAIYQGFLTALASIYLAYIIENYLKQGKLYVKEIVVIAIIHIGAGILYLTIQSATHLFISFPSKSYISQFFDISSMASSLSTILSKTWQTTLMVLSGDVSIYGLQTTSIPLLLGLSSIGLFVKLSALNTTILNKIFIYMLFLLLMILPFTVGVVLGGAISIRFLVAMPVAFAGVMFIGLNKNIYWLTIPSTVITIWAIFQFMVTTNHLFAASHLALEADRVFATRLIDHIEKKISVSNNPDVRYLDIVGYINRPPTLLIPIEETLGASFFSFNQGNPARIIFFLQTLGYNDLQLASLQKKVEAIKFVENMPTWPKDGSVDIFNDTVIVKFSPYSYPQIQRMCVDAKNEIRKIDIDFCQ